MNYKVLFLMFCLSTLSAHSQNGLTASLGVGFGSSDNSVFSDRLASYTPRDANNLPIIFKTEKFSNAGFVLQGSVAVGFSNLIFGANIDKTFYPKTFSINEQQIKQSEFVLGNTDISLSVGLPLVTSVALYPFFQAGLSNYNLSFTNNHNLAIPFFEGEPVLPSTTEEYVASGLRLGVGLAFNTAVSRTSGLFFGSKLLFGKMLSPAKWTQNGTEVKNGGNAPCHCGVTFTMSIGYGKLGI